MASEPTPPPPWRGTDLAHLTADQRAVLGRVLDEAGVPWDVAGGELQTPAADAELVDALVARAADATGEDEHDVAVFADVAVVDGQTVTVGPVIAGTGRRLVAYLVETLVLGLVIVLLRWVAGPLGPLLGYLVASADAVVLVAVLGGTAGMLVFGLRVVPAGADARVLPGWRIAIVRHLAVIWPFLLARAVEVAGGSGEEGWLGGVATIWTLVCFGPILFDPLRRGLHDRIAGTVVLDVRR